ncbi:MAG: Prolyl oligopeptidase [Actinomycetia bacterium]|nr:Prolyl oligopeptidase [Actinomycetes bacterium]
MTYPEAPRLDLVEDLHGHLVADPYRWLEDATSDETEAWSRAQDDLVRVALDGLPGRDHLRRRLRELLPGMVGPPTVLGDRVFHLRRLPDEEHAVLVVREGVADERVVLDPMALDPSGKTTLDAMSLSKEGDRLAYQVSSGGDELSHLWIVEVTSGDVVDGPIAMGRAGSVAWVPGGKELFYVRRLVDVPAGEEQFHRRVWRHRVGADIATDELVFGEGRDPKTYYGVSTSRDGGWLSVTAAVGTEPRNDLYLADLSTPALELVTVQEGVDARTSGGVRADDGLLWLFTDLDAPHYRLVVCDPRTPTSEHWRDLLRHDPLGVLTDYTITDDAVIAVRQRDVISEVTVHHRASGKVRAAVPLPGLGSASVTSRPEGGQEVWIGYSDHTTPYRVLHLDVPTGEVTVHAVPPGTVALPPIVATQVFVPSTGGVKVPMMVIAREDAPRDGARPTILYGYGGFGNSLTPSYASTTAAWVEAGGVYVVANLRGGNEYGEPWHRDGMRAAKQHTFDDFIACAERLIADGWTSPEHLGISGGSNGGLLVGAAATQRPDLFNAVVCSAPLLDMVRYERFGLGETWNDEYGSAAKPDELEWLLSYSPYHHVVEGTDYPAVLFTVFDGDSRVDPLHARKLCAALQWATSGERPILLRRERDVGHGARSVTRSIDLTVDSLTFEASRLGLAWPAS